MPVQEKAKEMREGFSEAGFAAGETAESCNEGRESNHLAVQKRRCETDANLKICHYKTLLVRAMALLVAWFAGAVELDVCEVRRRMRYGYC
jgi:hypothetical protein